MKKFFYSIFPLLLALILAPQAQAASANYGLTLEKQLEAYYSGKTVKGALIQATYTPDGGTHDFLDDVVAHEASGPGYTAGGQTITPTITIDTATNQVRVTFTSPSWSASSVSARYLLLYFDIGTNAQDELITIIDNGSTVTSSNSTFTFTISQPIVFEY